MRKIPSAFLAALLLIAALSVGSLFAAPGGGANWLSLGTSVSSNPFALGTPGLYSKNSDGKPRLVSVAGTEYVAGVAHDIRVYAGTPSGLATGSCWMDSTQGSRLVCREATGNIFQRYDPLAPGTFGCGGTPAAGCFTDLTTTGNVQLGNAAADIISNQGTLRVYNTANTFYVALTHAATANRAITLPDGAGEVVLSTRTVNTSAPLSGGGDLSANRTLSLSYASSLVNAGGSLALASNVRAATIELWIGNGATLNANAYLGLGGNSGSSATYVPAVLLPCSGSVIGLRVQSNSNATGNSVFTIHRSAGGATLSYSATSITCTVANGTKSCSDTSNTYSGSAGDLFLVRLTGSAITPTGASVSFRVACDPT